jgi:hypothetical protein
LILFLLSAVFESATLGIEDQDSKYSGFQRDPIPMANDIRQPDWLPFCLGIRLKPADFDW